jgi:hypothetical protein
MDRIGTVNNYKRKLLEFYTEAQSSMKSEALT